MKKLAFTVPELVIAIAFLALIVLAVFLAANPLEKANIERDDKLRRVAEELQVELEGYYITEGRFPWAPALGTSSAAPALAWTKADSPEIEVCKDDACRELWVSKGAQAQDPVYVCFSPLSKKGRDKVGQLIRISPGSHLPPSGMPEECPDGVTWVGADVCYLCITR